MSYTSQSIANYNANPPPDDGSALDSNTLTWAKHKTKLADPIKTLAEAINTANVNAWADLASTAIDDGTKGFHLVFYPLTSAESSAGVTPTNYEYPPGVIDRYGTNTTEGTTDMTAAAQAALDGLNTVDGKVIFRPGHIYNIASAVTAAVSGLTIEAYGARIITSNDITMFDLNSGFDGTNITTINNTLLREIAIYGGSWECSASSPSTGAAIKAYGVRNFVFEPEVVTGFNRGLLTTARDTWRITGGRWFDNVYCIEFPGTYAASTNNLEIAIRDAQFNIGDNSTGFIKIDGDYEDVKIIGGSMNIGTGATGFTMIEFDNSTGSASHNGIEIHGVHFENGGTSNVAVKFTATQAGGTTAYRNVEISGNNFNLNGTSCIAVDGDYMLDAYLFDNRFAQTTSGSNISVNIGANCTNMRFGPNSWSTAYPTINCSRDEVTFEPEIRQINSLEINGTSYSSGNQTYDMSTGLGSLFPSEAVPKGYWITMQAADSGSAGTDCRVRAMVNAAAAGSNYEKLLSLSGVTNDVRVGGTYYVKCDANGDIYLDYVASGANTLDLWFLVDALHM